MAEQQHNDASRKRKAEGERFSSAGSDIAPSSVSREDRGQFRASLHTPRRYDQPIEDDDDPVMPSDDATVNTKI